MRVSALGYDIGDSPAGERYLVVSFGGQFVPCSEVIYETF